MAKGKMLVTAVSLSATVFAAAVGYLAWRYPVDPDANDEHSPAAEDGSSDEPEATEVVDGWTLQVDSIELNLWGDTTYYEDEYEGEGEQYCGGLAVDFDTVGYVTEYGSFEMFELTGDYDEEDFPAETEIDLYWSACPDEETDTVEYYLNDRNGSVMSVIPPGAPRGPGDCEGALTNPVEEFSSDDDLRMEDLGFAEGATLCVLTAEDTLAQGVVRSVSPASFTVTTWAH